MTTNMRKSATRRLAAPSPSRVRLVGTTETLRVGPSVRFGFNTSGAELSNLGAAIAELTLLEDRELPNGNVETSYRGDARQLQGSREIVDSVSGALVEAIQVIGELLANVDDSNCNPAMRNIAGWTVSGLAAALGELQEGQRALAVARPLESAEA